MVPVAHNLTGRLFVEGLSLIGVLTLALIGVAVCLVVRRLHDRFVFWERRADVTFLLAEG